MHSRQHAAVALASCGMAGLSPAIEMTATKRADMILQTTRGHKSCSTIRTSIAANGQWNTP